MPRLLPPAQTLQQAVIRVIDSNTADGYRPTRFIQMTGGGYKEALPAICAGLILRGEALDHLEDAFRQNSIPYLTIEDYVSRFGKGWGFQYLVIQNAEARVSYFDTLVGGKRYA